MIHVTLLQAEMERLDEHKSSSIQSLIVVSFNMGSRPCD